MSPKYAQWRLGKIQMWNGDSAAYGTNAANDAFSAITRVPSCSSSWSERQYRHSPLSPQCRTASSSRARSWPGSTGMPTICECGWISEVPAASP